MLADYAEQIDLEFPQPSALTEADLTLKLPAIATVSNPLDYTTPIWGMVEKVTPVFNAALTDDYDAAVIVQDYPLAECDESKPFYLRDAQSFISVVSHAGIPGIVCATLSENIDQQTREFLIENGITPSQGIHEALDAISASAWYGKQRSFVLGQVSAEFLISENGDALYQIDEHAAKAALEAAGIKVPQGKLTDATCAAELAQTIGFPVVVKLNSASIAHKTEIGAVATGLNDKHELDKAVRQMQCNVTKAKPGLGTDTFLVERMLPKPVAELMVNIRRDSQFGLVMTLSSGGILVELFEDAITLILPVHEVEIMNALDRLKLSRMLNGYRGKEPANKQLLVASIKRLIDYIVKNQNRISEIEINPLFIYADEVYAVDVLAQLYRSDSKQNTYQTLTG